jgi:thiol-disulfide isomerase/thioredoxin
MLHQTGGGIRNTVTRPHGAVVLMALLLATPSCRDRGEEGRGAPETGVVTIDAAGVDSLRASSRSRVVLVNVWATWCAPCIKEMPGLVKLRTDYPDSDLEIIMVSTDDAEDLDSLVAPALSEAGVKFRTYILAGGNEDAFIRSMNPEWTGALPATFVYARGSSSVNWFVGGRTLEQLKNAVSGLLGD